MLVYLKMRKMSLFGFRKISASGRSKVQSFHIMFWLQVRVTLVLTNNYWFILLNYNSSYTWHCCSSDKHDFVLRNVKFKFFSVFIFHNFWNCFRSKSFLLPNIIEFFFIFQLYRMWQERNTLRNSVTYRTTPLIKTYWCLKK